MFHPVIVSYHIGFTVLCSIEAPNSITRNVGQDALFLWNTTNGNTILAAKWGLFKTKGAAPDPQFIQTDVLSNAPSFGSALDSTASSYKGRVDFIGNLSAGHAWFKISNLIRSDTNQYVAGIREKGIGNYVYYTTDLTVIGKHVYLCFVCLCIHSFCVFSHFFQKQIKWRHEDVLSK
jgi:hypothetical protein